MSVKSFVETILKDNTNTTDNKLIVMLDSKIYPYEFGISVRPLQVKYGTKIFYMKQLIDMFNKVPYIIDKENRYKSVYGDPMIMTIDLTPKQYSNEGSTSMTYYDYYIDKLCLRAELKRYLTVEKKALEVISEYKKNVSTDCETESTEEFKDNLMNE